ncbi:hypothetical protein HZB08_02885 [Candidatus Saganbacteria bacterium]|uniref:Uncharacterized protein n=1 Tax=Candidatus Saganbacteria bacterium TaxID=2575572 RepID=A0A9D6YT80_UNCSA|nr:hypothetical protein [Candidatus Saganbacteria bacterium]
MDAQTRAMGGSRQEKEWVLPTEVLPFILGSGLEKGAAGKKDGNLELFEKGLEKELRKEDSIEQAVSKMVKMALVAEFGPSLVIARGASKMITTITRAIMNDAKLRRQALIILDRLAQ